MINELSTKSTVYININYDHNQEDRKNYENDNRPKCLIK